MAQMIDINAARQAASQIASQPASQPQSQPTQLQPSQQQQSQQSQSVAPAQSQPQGGILSNFLSGTTNALKGLPVVGGMVASQNTAYNTLNTSRDRYGNIVGNGSQTAYDATRDTLSTSDYSQVQNKSINDKLSLIGVDSSKGFLTPSEYKNVINAYSTQQGDQRVIYDQDVYNYVKNFTPTQYANGQGQTSYYGISSTQPGLSQADKNAIKWADSDIAATAKSNTGLAKMGLSDRYAGNNPVSNFLYDISSGANDLATKTGLTGNIITGVPAQLIAGTPAFAGQVIQAGAALGTAGVDTAGALVGGDTKKAASIAVPITELLALSAAAGVAGTAKSMEEHPVEFAYGMALGTVGAKAGGEAVKSVGARTGLLSEMARPSDIVKFTDQNGRVLSKTTLADWQKSVNTPGASTPVDPFGSTNPSAATSTVAPTGIAAMKMVPDGTQITGTLIKGKEPIADTLNRYLNPFKAASDPNLMGYRNIGLLNKAGMEAKVQLIAKPMARAFGNDPELTATLNRSAWLMNQSPIRMPVEFDMNMKNIPKEIQPYIRDTLLKYQTDYARVRGSSTYNQTGNTLRSGPGSDIDVRTLDAKKLVQTMADAINKDFPGRVSAKETQLVANWKSDLPANASSNTLIDAHDNTTAGTWGLLQKPLMRTHIFAPGDTGYGGKIRTEAVTQSVSDTPNAIQDIQNNPMGDTFWRSPFTGEPIKPIKIQLFDTKNNTIVQKIPVVKNLQIPGINKQVELLTRNSANADKLGQRLNDSVEMLRKLHQTTGEQKYGDMADQLLGKTYKIAKDLPMLDKDGNPAVDVGGKPIITKQVVEESGYKIVNDYGSAKTAEENGPMQISVTKPSASPKPSPSSVGPGSLGSSAASSSSSSDSFDFLRRMGSAQESPSQPISSGGILQSPSSGSSGSSGGSSSSSYSYNPSSGSLYEFSSQSSSSQSPVPSPYSLSAYSSNSPYSSQSPYSSASPSNSTSSSSKSPYYLPSISPDGKGGTRTIGGKRVYVNNVEEYNPMNGLLTFSQEPATAANDNGVSNGGLLSIFRNSGW